MPNADEALPDSSLEWFDQSLRRMRAGQGYALKRGTRTDRRKEGWINVRALEKRFWRGLSIYIGNETLIDFIYSPIR